MLKKVNKNSHTHNILDNVIIASMIIFFFFIMVLAGIKESNRNAACREETGFFCDSEEYECKQFCYPDKYFYDSTAFGTSECECHWGS